MAEPPLPKPRSLRKRLLAVALAVLVTPPALFGLAWADMEVRSTRSYSTEIVVPPLEAGDAQVGAHLLVIAKCGMCHGSDLGGGVLLDDPMLGAIRGPNLTPSGAPRSDADLVRALRRGLSASGRPLLAMPTTEHAWFSDAEIASVVAAIRALPPVVRPDVPCRLGPGMVVLGALGQIEMLSIERLDPALVASSVVPGATAAYGEHLAHIGSCFSCHGEHLAGGPMAGAPPDWPPAANLTPDTSGLVSWTEADFTRAMRSGVRPDGTGIDPKMPWVWTAQMTDEEIQALYRYLRVVAPAPTGGQ